VKFSSQTFVAVLAAAAAPLTQAQLVSIDWDGAGRFDRQLVVAPGKFVELCEKLPSGAKMQWRFEAGAPVNLSVDLAKRS
jgi:hypothetical protein